MQVGTLTLNCTMQDILDKMLLQLRASNSVYFSRGYRLLNGYYLVQCPFHKFGRETKPSGEFRESDGLFYCFTCRDTHSLEEVISHCLNVNGKEWLIDNFDGTEASQRKIAFNISRNTEKQDQYFVSPSIVKQFERSHPYMYKRKITDEIIKKFHLGVDPNFKIDLKDNRGNTIGHKDIGECITFPVRDIDGNVLFIARRSTTQKFFHYPEGIDKPIYGLYEVLREIKRGKEVNEVYVCESMIDALTLWSWGKYAIALNGTGTSKQYEILRNCPLRYFILATDNDFAGKKAREKFRKEIKNKIIRELDYQGYKDSKDVNDMSKEQFDELQII